MTVRSTNSNKGFDLEERTAKFAELVLEYCKLIPDTNISRVYIQQLARSSSSVGANYCEANDALTRKDFIYRVGVCRKEAKESKYWLRMLKSFSEKQKDLHMELLQEATELTLIFSKIIVSSRLK